MSDWRWFNKTRLRLRSVLQRTQVEAELDEEIRAQDKKADQEHVGSR